MLPGLLCFSYLFFSKVFGILKGFFSKKPLSGVRSGAPFFCLIPIFSL